MIEAVIKLGRYKLQRLRRSYYFAIPKVWVKSKNLKKGSKLEILLDSDGNSLIKSVLEEMKNGN